jgi:hypothetical protein
MSIKPTPAWDPRAYPSRWINHAPGLVMRAFEEALAPIGLTMAHARCPYLRLDPGSSGLERAHPLDSETP